MLDVDRVRAALPRQGLGEPFEFHRSLGSTNDRAAQLARAGGPEGALVLAEEQTAGRGRGGSPWMTPPGSALAFSLVLRPRGLSGEAVSGLAAIGALAVAEALEAQGAPARIKWPNDVLLEGRKVAGVLVEAAWAGADLEHAILGIGVNVRRASVPPDSQAAFPATCVEAAVGRSVEREAVLLGVLDGLGRWIARLGSLDLQAAWEQRLAFRKEEVRVWDPEGGLAFEGVLIGLLPDGRLRLLTPQGREAHIRPEGVHLRPAAGPGSALVTGPAAARAGGL